MPITDLHTTVATTTGTAPTVKTPTAQSVKSLTQLSLQKISYYLSQPCLQPFPAIPQELVEKMAANASRSSVELENFLNLNNADINSFSHISFPDTSSIKNISKCIDNLPSTLEVIAIHDSDAKITDEDIKKLGQRCPHLKSITLHGCTQLTAAGIARMLESCKSLQHVDIKPCDFANHLFASASGWIASLPPSVETIAFSHDAALNDVALQSLGQCCPNLKSIAVRNCNAVTNAGLKNLLASCPLLQHINIQQCAGVHTQELVKDLVAYCTPKQLQHLRLIGYRNISDDNIQQLTQCFTRLTHWAITPMPDQSIQHLANLTHLQAISLTNNHMQEADLQKISQNNPELTSIRLQNCSGLSDAFLTQLQTTHPQLAIENKNTRNT